jgi:hypothetical protein
MLLIVLCGRRLKTYYSWPHSDITYILCAVVQVMVETTLGKEELKEAILMCTNRVS